MHLVSGAGLPPSIDRITGVLMLPQPGMNAEKRPVVPPATNKWIFSGLGTIGMRESNWRLSHDGRLRLYTLPYRFSKASFPKAFPEYVTNTIGCPAASTHALQWSRRARGKAQPRNDRSQPRYCGRLCSWQSICCPARLEDHSPHGWLRCGEVRRL